MIKVIAFDLVGVLVKEKDIILSTDEDKIEKLFGANISDEEFINDSKKIVGNKDIIALTNNVISKLYEIKDNTLIDKVREKYPTIKIIIATNHISLIRNYLNKHFNGLDIIISGEINKVKPKKDFFDYIIEKYHINYSELLFLDDRKENVDAANNLEIKTIKVDDNTNIYQEIIRVVDVNLHN